MTTIVFHAGQIAWDSRGICAGVIHDNTKKHFKRKGVHFWIAGSTCDIEDLIKAYFGADIEDLESQAFVYDKGKLCVFGIDDDKKYKTPVSKKETMVIGTGSEHAYTAIDMGCDAKESVQMAKKRDANTGGKVHVKELFPD